MAINELARLAVKAESEAAGGGSHQGAARPRLRQGNAANPRTVDYGISQQLAEVFKEKRGQYVGSGDCASRGFAASEAALTWPRAGASRFRQSPRQVRRAGEVQLAHWQTGENHAPSAPKSWRWPGPTRSTPLRTRSHARAWKAAPTHARAAKQMTDPPAQLTSHRPRGKASGLYSWLYFGRIGYGE
jgi:hypothetical protein